jgi:3D (Asp-Asp-Asp) domain-containing protein
VAVAAAAGKPRDKHAMPVYAFSDRNRIVRTTAYTCSEDDHLIYGSKNATGTQLRYSNSVRSAAADWSFYPVGTTFRIKGLPYLYVVDDYGSALLGTGTVDIYKPSKDVMNLWGRRNVELTIVQWGSFARSAELLGQRTKHDHCRKMLANIVRQRPDLGRVAKL